jgi:hypothetical protein
MLAARDNSGVLRNIAMIRVRDAGNVLRTISDGMARDAAGALRAFFGTLSVSVAPEEVTGGANSSGSPQVQTQIATATPSGGTSPYTYLWERTDAGGDTWSIASPTSASTRFLAQGVGPNTTATAEFACTVIDAHGLEAVSADIAASATNFSTLGGGPLP